MGLSFVTPRGIGNASQPLWPTRATQSRCACFRGRPCHPRCQTGQQHDSDCDGHQSGSSGDWNCRKFGSPGRKYHGNQTHPTVRRKTLGVAYGSDPWDHARRYSLGLERGGTQTKFYGVPDCSERFENTNTIPRGTRFGPGSLCCISGRS